MPESMSSVSTGPAIRTFLDISSAHVTESVMDSISTLDDVIADPTPFGAWVWVPGDSDIRIREEEDRTPQCVIDIWRYARSLGCDYVHLDRDAEIHEQLPTYSW